MVIQKAIALHIISLGICSILEACAQAAVFSNFSVEAIKKWAVEIFRDYFSTLSSIEDVTDETLELKLTSSRGKHSMMDDENFRKKAQKYIRENGYVKGKPNLNSLACG